MDKMNPVKVINTSKKKPIKLAFKLAFPWVLCGKETETMVNMEFLGRQSDNQILITIHVKMKKFIPSGKKCFN